MENKGKHILLVEDEAVIALAQKQTLERYGFRVDTVCSGEAALSHITTEPSFDLVLMDIDLGSGMSGTEAAKAILQNRSLPIVFLTNHGEADMMERVRDITRYGYVLKNSGNSVLLSSIEMAFELFEANRKAQESAEKLKTIFTALGDRVFVIDRQGRYLEIADETFTSTVLSDVFDSKLTAWFIEVIAKVLERHAVEMIEYPLMINDREVWFLATISPLDSKSVVWVARDISKRKAAEQEAQRLVKEKELLLREVHHRIKNNMATIAAVLDLQASMLGENDTSGALLEARNRVHGMMELYHRLYGSGDYRSVDAAGYLQALFDEIKVSYSLRRDVEYKSTLEAITLDAKILFPLGMIANELVTNAIKYAFPCHGKGGSIFLGLEQAREGELLLTVADNGIGMDPSIDPKTSRGFGLSLVANLAIQLRSKWSLSREGGSRYRFEIPIGGV
ncbi:response regulator [Sediminispirochaeta bajacaliforniensis]|uniref:response regulator n=1 Tax=Sediminispirochaeta bajacaliforniensis TaxID=148 RepID=UPI00036CA47F|nr:response regulator [Sediminispirochaeta bajacaliforniensis]